MKKLHLVFVTLVAVALGAPANASAAGSSRCKTSSTTGGAKAFAKSKHAVLFTKRHTTYGCLYRRGHIYQLRDEGDIEMTGSNKPVLEGRFAAYGTYGSAIGDEYDQIVVFDLRTGKVTFETSAAASLDDIVLKRNGSVGWILDSPVQSATDQPLREVHEYSTVDRQGDVLLARSRTIDAASLALRPDRQTMTWRAGGGSATFTAPLR